MNISYPTPITVGFDEIMPGEVFGFKDKLYIRIQGSCIPRESVHDYVDCYDNTEYEAVCLHDGSLHSFADETFVEKVTTYTRVEYDRKE